ncbi:7336_t:CDS:2 [Acaulospora colombiana]|uniref:7336_t:CDS:1 n=1 Tax=Acaulospora colombiana TaxID=27376 RepID=A0ACA9K3R7_9GLOM|nr:7336_t:CDS:2 [Acaulospora colombiana]
MNEKSSGGVLHFWTEIEKRQYEDNIEKESVYDSIKDSKDARTFLSDKLKSFVKEHARKRNHTSIKKLDHMEDSQGRKESYESNPDLHTPDPKKVGQTRTNLCSFLIILYLKKWRLPFRSIL